MISTSSTPQNRSGINLVETSNEESTGYGHGQGGKQCENSITECWTDDSTIFTSDTSLSSAKTYDEHAPEQKQSISVKEGRKKFGLLTVIAIFFSSVVGSGALTTPQYVYLYTGNAAVSLIIWFSYGIVAMLGALCYVELGTTFPAGGGDYAFVNEAFGSLAAFLYQWSGILVFIPAVDAVLGLVAADYLMSPFASYQNCPSSEWSKRALSICFICLLSYINCANPNTVGKFNTAFTGTKILVLGLVNFSGFYYAVSNGFYKNEDFKLRPAPDAFIQDKEYTTAHIVRAIFQVGFTYNGFNQLVCLSQEIRNPRRNIPLAICISMPVVIVFYVLTNVMYFVTLDKPTLINTRAIGSEMFKAVVSSHDWQYASWVAPTLISLSILSTMSIKILASSRVNLAGARNRHCPAFLSIVNQHSSSPVASIVTQATMSIIWTICGSIPFNITLAYYTEGIFSLAVMYSLIFMRINKPSMHRPIKFPLLMPITYSLIMTSVFLSVFCTMDIASLLTELSFMGGVIGVFGTGVPVYFLCVKNGPRWEWLRRFHGSITKLFQKILLGIPEERTQM